MLGRRVWSAAGLVAVLAFGCTFDRGEHEDSCRDEEDCASGERCVRGFCVRAEDDAGGGPGTDAGSDAGMGDGGQTGTPCAPGQPPEPCYDGPEDTRDVGMCRGGERACVGGVFTQCLGQVLPAEEDCNDRDDDCDGTVDEIEMSEPCDTAMRGVCKVGMLVCRGAFAVCEPQALATDEVCNGSDDDCDGEVDEIAESECYPAGASGCTMDASGAWQCAGVCKTGRTVCQDGQGQCVGAVTPQAEQCTTGGATAADENCDSSIDENCTCTTTGEMRPCYGGPPGSEAHPPCQAGTQTCVAGSWTACQGQVLPGTETCQNMGTDDDCDGNPDDLPQLGEPCMDPNAYGLCRNGTRECTAGAEQPVCVAGDPTAEICDGLDQDCDRNVDEGLLGTDAHCSECGDACGDGAQCCRGQCIDDADLRHDPRNCGRCGNECGAGNYCCWNQCIPGGDQLPGIFGAGLPKGEKICACKSECERGLSCCGESCVDLQNDTQNCGFCGNRCGLRQQCCKGTCALLCAVEL